MSEFADFKPLRRETVQTIRARLDRDANAGKSPNDFSFLDTTEGGFYWDLTQPGVLEFERLWDMATTESPAVSFPAWAYGEYLDEHGITYDIPRKPAVKATGSVTFAGFADTIVSTDVRVAVPATSADTDPVEFVTTAGGVIPDSGDGQGALVLPIEADEAGDAGNVLSGQITFLSSPVDGISSISNVFATTGGADVESDADYSERQLLDLSSAQGAGTQTDYVRWALSIPGIGMVTVEPLFAGNGTVRVIITDTSNKPVSVALLNTVQQYLDPVPAAGEGQAPIGAAVTVATPTQVFVTVGANVDFFPGYSLDGALGTIPVQDQIVTSIVEYLDGLAPGNDAVLKHVEAQFFRVAGVEDVSGTVLNGVATNVTIAPMQVAAVARDGSGVPIVSLT